MLKLLTGVILGFCICAIGIDVVLKTIRIGGEIIEHTIEYQLMQDKNKIQYQEDPAKLPTVPTEINNAKTV